MTRSPGRGGHAWRKTRQAILAHDTTCWICGQPGADTVDHVIPLALGGAPLDPTNLRPAHHHCNSQRGDGTRGTNTQGSRDW